MVDYDFMLQNKELVVPYLFTSKQLELIKKKIYKKQLTKTEQVYFSRTIIKKINAIKNLTQVEKDYFIYGREYMLTDRIKKAVKILKKQSRKHRNKKILITGTFLYSKKYNDIDIFIISKKPRDDYKEKNIHINYLPEDIVNKLFFQSLSKLSISNFYISPKKVIDKFTLNKILTKYEQLIIFILNKHDFKIELKEFILICSYLQNKDIPGSYHLNIVYKKILKSKIKIDIINRMLIITLISFFKLEYLKRDLKKIIIQNEKAKKETKIIDNLNLYNKTYGEVIRVGC